MLKISSFESLNGNLSSEPFIFPFPDAVPLRRPYLSHWMVEPDSPGKGPGSRQGAGLCGAARPPGAAGAGGGFYGDEGYGPLLLVSGEGEKGLRRTPPALFPAGSLYRLPGGPVCVFHRPDGRKGRLLGFPLPRGGARDRRGPGFLKKEPRDQRDPKILKEEPRTGGSRAALWEKQERKTRR